MKVKTTDPSQPRPRGLARKRVNIGMSRVCMTHESSTRWERYEVESTTTRWRRNESVSQEVELAPRLCGSMSTWGPQASRPKVRLVQ